VVILFDSRSSAAPSSYSFVIAALYFVIAAVFSPTVVPRRLVTRSSALDSRAVRQRLKAAAFWAVLCVDTSPGSRCRAHASPWPSRGGSSRGP
jgi:hypothetical protein